MTQTVLYSGVIATVGILLITVMGFDVMAHATDVETEREFDTPTLKFRADGAVATFTVKTNNDDPETWEVQMKTSGNKSVVCFVPIKDINIKRPLGKTSIEYNTNDLECTRNADLGGVVSLTIEPNGDSSYKHKTDTTDCSVSSDRTTLECIRVQETSEGGTIDVRGTLFGVSFENGKGEMGLKDTMIKTTIKNVN